jgi:putative membrane protein
MDSEFWKVLWHQLIETFVFGFIGVLLCSLFFWVLVKISPFSIRKEIEEDQNISLGLIIGAAIIGIAIIISAAVTRG